MIPMTVPSGRDLPQARGSGPELPQARGSGPELPQVQAREQPRGLEQAPVPQFGLGRDPEWLLAWGKERLRKQAQHLRPR